MLQNCIFKKYDNYQVLTVVTSDYCGHPVIDISLEASLGRDILGYSQYPKAHHWLEDVYLGVCVCVCVCVYVCEINKYSSINLKLKYILEVNGNPSDDIMHCSKVRV